MQVQQQEIDLGLEQGNQQSLDQQRAEGPIPEKGEVRLTEGIIAKAEQVSKVGVTQNHEAAKVEKLGDKRVHHELLHHLGLGPDPELLDEVSINQTDKHIHHDD